MLCIIYLYNTLKMFIYSLTRIINKKNPNCIETKLFKDIFSFPKLIN